VRIAAIQQPAPDIRIFDLVSASGDDLPSFSAGSHVLVSLRHEDRVLRNAYSLACSPLQRQHYCIAVRRQAHSRGGSAFLHAHVRVDDLLELSSPANLFPIDRKAARHLLIAGGIGITPFLGYVSDLADQNADFELHYAFRSTENAAFLDELNCHWRSRCHAYDGARGERLDPAHLLAEQPLGTHVYVCGPTGLTQDVIKTARELGWPDSHIHSEGFSSPVSGTSFHVFCARSQRNLHVGADHSLLEALEAAGVEVPNLCRGGVCGQCETELLEGIAEHRDSYLSLTEQANRIMPCVSRARGASLVLNL
jgi:ferredoxin-NADP reductase